MGFASKILSSGFAVGGGALKLAGKAAISRPGQYLASGVVGGAISVASKDDSTVSQKMQSFAAGAVAGVAVRGALGATAFAGKMAGKSIMKKADKSMAKMAAKQKTTIEKEELKNWTRQKGTAEANPKRDWEKINRERAAAETAGETPTPASTEPIPTPTAETAGQEAAETATKNTAENVAEEVTEEGGGVLSYADEKLGAGVNKVIEKGTAVTGAVDTLTGIAATNMGGFFSKMDEWAGAAIQNAGGLENVGNNIANKAGRGLGKALTYGTMGMMGTIAYGMVPDAKVSSPTLAGNKVDINYSRDQANATSLNSVGVMPTGQTTAASLMRLSQSTQGLVQGLHRNRHG